MSDINIVEEIITDNFDTAVLTVEGVIDANTASIFENSLLNLINRGVINILVDVEKVTYISSAGLGAFMSALDTLENKNNKGKISILKSSPQFIKVFNMMGFDEIFKSFNTIEEALKAWGKNGK
ncbi:MAG TPA: STAS domain-containing protein [bacterium]|nr:STAS domain-containing protein [bacterium]HPQ19518.1 STAS domain-containing protein [bacterium]